MQRLFDRTIEGAAPGEVDRGEVYAALRLPHGVDHPTRRPYTAINMVSTLDGKVVVGGPGTTRLIGTPTDHYLMGKIEFQADGVLLGAGLVRDDNPPYPTFSEQQVAERQAMGLRPRPVWAVVSSRGDFPQLPRLFAGGTEHSALFTTEAIPRSRLAELARHTRVFVLPGEQVDPLQMGRLLREEMGVASLICLGGPALNGSLLEAGAADELFFTLAPKVRGGRGLSTMVEGRGHQPAAMPRLELLSIYADGSELYLRYKLPPQGELEVAAPAASGERFPG